MQVLLLGLFVAVYLHDDATAVEVYRDGELIGLAEAMPGDAWPGLGAGLVLLIVLLPKLCIAAGYFIACKQTRRRLGTPRGPRAMNLLEAATSALPLLLLALFVIDLSVGALRTVRVPLQHIVLIDEVLVLLPTLLVAVLAWVSYYPVDHRLREALLMRDADAGRPVYPPQSCSGYVVMQLRHQFGLLLLPLLAVFGWAEAMTLLGPDFDGPLTAQTTRVLTPVGVLVVFLIAPLVIRRAWDTAPLPAGEVRDRMETLCKRHRVRVRELLLWRTGGRMANAAVMGLASPVRFILLSDGLLDRLTPRSVEAVMAHELAHVKLKHVIWMGLFVIAILGTLEQAGHLALNTWADPPHTANALTPPSEPWLDLTHAPTRMLIVSAPAFLIAIAAFGWVSRRIERQADVFAARHLAQDSTDKRLDRLGQQVFDEPAVQAMVDALQKVSELNHAPTTRRSWRHGSIAWRQDHLRSLVGRPIDQTPVDRVLLRVKLATLVGLIAVVIAYTQ